jgi:1,4-alpha-glucan branching enzyme
MREPVGDLAIVLHAHMPYVEGFGTYPFGEEWLFDAVARSYLPVLEFAERVSVTVTPVLADQLEAPGVPERLEAFIREFRLGLAESELGVAGTGFSGAARAQADRYRSALDRLEELGGKPLEAFSRPNGDGRIDLLTSSATHAILPLLATDRGLELQVLTGIRSHHRRFGRSGGFWLPECAYEPDLEYELARNGVEWFCVDQSSHESGTSALTPVRTAAGPLAFTIDWEAVSWLWDRTGYPSWEGYLDFHAQSAGGAQLYSIAGRPYDPDLAAEQAGSDADRFLGQVGARLSEFREETGERGLVVMAFDLELLGHWWAEGPIWLRRVLQRADAAGVHLVRLSEAADRGIERQAELMPSSWGEGKDLRTWDGPGVFDMAGAARRAEVGLDRAVRNGMRGERLERAARELLALQASDWAFLDGRGEAGDYGFERAVGHARAVLEAIDCPDDEPPEPGVRHLAPEPALGSLLVP